MAADVSFERIGQQGSGDGKEISLFVEGRNLFRSIFQAALGDDLSNRSVQPVDLHHDREMLKSAALLESKINSMYENDLFSSYQEMGRDFSEEESRDLFKKDRPRGFITRCDRLEVISWELLKEQLKGLKEDDQFVILASLNQQGLEPFIGRSSELLEGVLPEESVPRIAEDFSPENPASYEILLNQGSPILKITAPFKVVALDFSGDLPMDRDALKFTLEITIDFSELKKTATCRVLPKYRKQENSSGSSLLSYLRREFA